MPLPLIKKGKTMETKQRTKNKKLTDRELELIKLIAGGFNDFEISKKLSIKAQTIRGMVNKILEKTETMNRPQLVFYACQNSIITND